MWLGSCFNARDVEDLTRRRIGRIINVASEEKSADTPSIVVIKCPLPDQVENEGEMQKVFAAWRVLFAELDKVGEDGRGVLVHCKHGQSRSAAVLISWLMGRESISLDVALARVQACRPSVNPNDGVMAQLKAYAAQHQQQQQQQSQHQGK